MKQIPMEVRDFSFFQTFLVIFLANLVDFQLLLLLYSVWQCIFFVWLETEQKWGLEQKKMASFWVLGV